MHCGNGQLAHSPDKFSLEDHENVLGEMSSIGEGVDIFAEYSIQAMHTESGITNLLDADAKREPEDRLFQSREDVIEKIRGTSTWTSRNRR